MKIVVLVAFAAAALIGMSQPASAGDTCYVVGVTPYEVTFCP